MQSSALQTKSNNHNILYRLFKIFKEGHDPNFPDLPSKIENIETCVVNLEKISEHKRHFWWRNDNK